MSMTSGPSAPLITGKSWVFPLNVSFAEGSASDIKDLSICIIRAYCSAAKRSIQQIVDPRHGFLPPEHVQHIEYGGRGRRASESGTQGLRKLAQLDAVVLRMGFNSGFKHA